MWVYAIIRFFAKIFYKIAFRVEVIGMENVPKDGAAVLCCNHISNFDPFTVAIFLDRLPRYIAKKELFRNRFIRWILNQVQAFPVDRDSIMDMKAFKTAVNVLKSGELLGIFAEGTRVKEGEVKSAKAGVALFAIKGGAPVIPVAISGDYTFRSVLTIAYGAPMACEEYREGRLTTEKMEAMTDEIMEKVNEMKVHV